MKTRLQPTGHLNVRGTVTWAKVSEQSPIDLSIKGATPRSQVFLKVCGPTMNGETGSIADQCWATFGDIEHHVLGVDVNRWGQAHADLYAKMGAGPLSLMKANRFELYGSATATRPIARGQIEQTNR